MRPRPLVLTLLALLATSDGGAAGPVSACGLGASLVPTIRPDGSRGWLLQLRNEGRKSLRLVEPGDGSDVGWRTPLLSWTATREGEPVPRRQLPRCGNMNGIGADEIFALEPGEMRMMSPWCAPPFPSGTYEVQLRYENDPSRIATDDRAPSPRVAALLAHTSTCVVTTPPVTMTVP